MLVNGFPRDSFGRFIKGIAYAEGRKASDKTKEKQRQAKLKNPTKYWLNKRRFGLSKNGGYSVVGGYRYIAYSIIEEWILKFLVKRKNTISEHQYVWIKYHKKKIPKGHHIHHINKNKQDNRIENLVCLTTKQHGRIHRKYNTGKPLNSCPYSAKLLSLNI